MKEKSQAQADREEMEIATLATVDPREVLFDRVNELDAEFSADIIDALKERDEIRQGEIEMMKADIEAGFDRDFWEWEDSETANERSFPGYPPHY